MYNDEFTAVASAAAGKVKLLKRNPMGYFILSILAGIFIGFGVLLVFTLGGSLEGAPYTKLVMGCSFAVALSLVSMAGAELFTGNNLVMAAGILRGTVKVSDAIQLWCTCWIGNLIGSIILAVAFSFSGLYVDATIGVIWSTAIGKMTAAPIQLIIRAILCNMLVCLAIWSGFRVKSESGRLIMIFWCIFAFFATGFEHSIANMTTLALALLANTGDAAITMSGYWYNLILVTIGNMIGGIVLIALPYHIASRKVEE